MAAGLRHHQAGKKRDVGSQPGLSHGFCPALGTRSHSSRLQNRAVTQTPSASGKR